MKVAILILLIICILAVVYLFYLNWRFDTVVRNSNIKQVVYELQQNMETLEQEVTELQALADEILRRREAAARVMGE